MNNITGANFNGGQYQSNLVVAYAGNLIGWDEAGNGTVHIVDVANVYGSATNTPNYVIMFWVDNIITQTTAVSNSNVANTQYVVTFKAGPAVYQISGQATQATASDGIVFEVLRANNTVLATSTYLPGAWAGYPTLTSSSFNYTGDGTGDVRIRIKTVSSSTNRFGGCVDDVVITRNYITPTELTISGDVAIINAFTASPLTVNVSQAADISYNSGTTSFQVLVSNQTAIAPTLGTFTVASSKAYGDASFNITTRPTSNSSGAITYSSSNTAVATIDTSGNWINIVGVGDVSFNATQAEVPNQFTSASISSNTLTVSKATPTLTFSNPPTAKNVTDAAFTVTASGGVSPGAVTYSSSNTAFATVGETTGLVTLTGAGTVTITATQASTSLYNSTTATCSIVISAAGSTLAGQTVASGTSFDGVNLSGASFVGTTLSGVSFSGATLTNVNFSGAVITGTDFTNANISGATNLPEFSTVQKLQLLKNINNVSNGAVQVSTVSGSALSQAISTTIDNIGNLTFAVVAPTTLDASSNKIITVTIFIYPLIRVMS